MLMDEQGNSTNRFSNATKFVLTALLNERGYYGTAFYDVGGRVAQAARRYRRTEPRV